MCNHTDLSLMSCTLPAKTADLLLLISKLFFFQKLNRGYGPYIIETERKVLMTSCFFKVRAIRKILRFIFR